MVHRFFTYSRSITPHERRKQVTAQVSLWDLWAVVAISKYCIWLSEQGHSLEIAFNDRWLRLPGF